MLTIVPINGKAQHGKDTMATHLSFELVKLGKRVLIVRFADYLKFIAKEYFGWNGEKDDDGRTLLQWLGTDKVRAKNPDFWVDTLARFVGMFEEDFDFFLIPDARFPNEADDWELRSLKFGNGQWQAVTVKVVRPNFDNGLTEALKSHSSETSMDNFEFDYVFESDTMTELSENAQKLARILVGNQ
jgi:hypothetical protein